MPELFCCLVCRGPNSLIIHADVPDYFLATDTHATYVVCEDCGLVQQYPLPSNTARFYAGYPVHSRKPFWHQAARMIALRSVYFDARELKPEQTVLDYGCGDGWFLERARLHGASVYGFEFFPEQARAVSRCTGVQVFSDSGEMVKILRGQVDIVTLHFVLEHLTDLRGTFEQLSALLRVGGVLRAVLPNLDNLEYKWFGPRWHGFDAPRHISFPTPRHLDRIAHETGLERVQQRFVAFPNTLAASLSIWLAGRYRPLLFGLFYPLAYVWSHLYPKGTVAITYRKP